MPASLRIFLLSLAPGLIALTVANMVFPGQPLQAAVIAAGGCVIGALLAAAWTTRAIAGPLVDLTHKLRDSDSAGRLVLDSETATREICQLATALSAATQASAALSHQNEQAVLSFAQRMAVELDARDPYSVGHSLRVSRYSTAVGTQLGMSAADRETLRIGAVLHDIGKVGIPDVVLQKKGSLTWVEYAEVKKHPVTGKRLLEGIELCRPYLPIVELHHENHDGSGYPWGLKGEETPLAARIVHVVDAFDAMTSERPFRDAISPEKALEILKRNVGTQFDPAVVEAFEKAIADDAELIVSPQAEAAALEPAVTS